MVIPTKHAMERLVVLGLDALLQEIEKRQSGTEDVYILFCGSAQPETGESWCPDCVKAEPIIEKVLMEQENGVFIQCSVGVREEWKDPQNVFRKHPKLQLKGVPTLVQWNTPKKLGPDDCANEKLVRMLFEED